MTALGLVLLGLGCWLVVSVAVAWAWARAGRAMRRTRAQLDWIASLPEVRR